MKVNPTTSNVSQWLKSLSREELHEQGWIIINQRFHGVARAARPFIRANFANEDQEAAFDGFTLALLAVTRFEDIGRLSRLFETPTNIPEITQKSLPTKL